MTPAGAECSYHRKLKVAGKNERMGAGICPARSGHFCPGRKFARHRPRRRVFLAGAGSATKRSLGGAAPAAWRSSPSSRAAVQGSWVPGNRSIGGLVDVLGVAIHHFMTRSRNPLIDLSFGQEMSSIKFVPIGDLAQVFFPTLVRQLRRWPEAHNVEH